MVQDKGGRGSAFNTGFDSGRVVRKQMLGTFDSVRSVSSLGDIYSHSQSSSGGDDTGTLIEFRLFSIKSLNKWSTGEQARSTMLEGNGREITR